ncbi:MAG: site-specific integrase [Microthrixaceae bacterium]|nr:site-specific integrase [Microthrixaceae bacterium]
MSLIAPTLQSFFTERLVHQRQASPATVASYRDSLRLLVGFAAEHTGKAPSALDFEDLNTEVISAFLTHLETERHNTARTRNNRLAAIRALFRYAALRHPEHAELIARVLAIPQKRHDKAIITFLTHDEAQALLAAPDPGRWEGRRDRALLALAVQTGLRLAELTNLNCGDVTLGSGAHVSCVGKGRKQRVVPLTANTAAVLRTWTRERQGLNEDPLFPTRTGRQLSTHGIQRRVTLHVNAATGHCPSLAAKNVTPHVLRHTAAMALLQAGVDVSVIALWLGHEDIRSTQTYLHADLAIKERALAATTTTSANPGRFKPADPLLAFLEAL